MSNTARYTNGHLFSVYGDRNPLTEQLARTLGGLNDLDFENFDKFAQRAQQLGDLALEKNLKLYVDAEQTFIQDAIESFG